MNYKSTVLPRVRNWLILGGFLLCSGLAGLNGQTTVAASGDQFSAVIDASGNLYTFGANGAGQLGVENVGAFSANIRLVEPTEGWAQVAVSRGGGDRAHVLAIQTDGSLWAWGANDRGQLGIGNLDDQPTPVMVDNSVDWAEVACGTEYSMGLTTDGQIYVWGDNSFGQLGRPIADPGQGGVGVPGSTENRILSPELLDGNTYLTLAAGDTTGFAIRLEGLEQNLYSWGYSQSAQLGLTSGSLSVQGPLSAPNRVGSRTDWSRVFAGSDMSFGIASGYLYVWGAGAWGHDGIAPGTAAPNTPTRVNSSNDWASVSVGETHTLALKTDGALYGWGDNQQGQLGMPLRDDSGRTISANQNFSTPKLLQSGATFSAIGAGDGFSIIYSDLGFLLSAGVDEVGQLADGTASLGIKDSFESSSLGLSDLVAASIVVNGEATPGGPLSATLFLRNDGTGTIEDNFEVDAVLSSGTIFSGLGAQDLDFDNGGGIVETITVTTDIGPGENLSVPVTINLPSPINQGSYYLVFRADIAGVLEEVTTANNTVALAPEDRLDFTADLQVASILVEPVTGIFPSSPGEPVEVTIEIDNSGKGAIPAGKAFDLRVLLALTPNLNNAGAIDLLTAYSVTDGIPGNGSLTVSFTDAGANALDLPLNLPLGDYYLGVDLDVGGTGENGDIAESVEDNNSAFTSDPDVEISGIELEEALDTGLITTPVDFNFMNTSIPAGLPDWFGQSLVTFDAVDAAQSPPLSPGQRATMLNAASTEAYSITFRWRAETSSDANYLFFALNGVEVVSPNSRITGSSDDWEVVTFVVPANAQPGWTYVQGAAGANDVVYVDTISVASIDDPDLIISSVEGQAGSYVLQRDPMSLDILLRNQGSDTTSNFNIGVYLSFDNNFDVDDRKVDTISRTGGISGSFNPILVPTFDLPEDLDSGDYYLILVVDETDSVDEGTSGGEDNNIFVSEDPDVTIQALPDIEITSEDVNAIPGYYLVGEQLDFDFRFENVGLTGITDPIRNRVVISSDNQADSTEDFLITEFDYVSGLPVGVTASFDPDFYTIQSGVPMGRRSYIGLVADVDEAIAETNESNNAAVFPQRNFIFSEMTVEEAFGLTGEAIQNEDPPYDDVELPWFGQSEVSFTDGAAAQSLEIINGETSAFQTEITADNDTFVTFHWKVSSETLNEETGKVGDILAFYVNDFNPDNYVRAIQGDVDWRQVSVFLEAGTHQLRWAYIKDGTISVGADAGWVDNFSFQIPDLVVDSISVATGSFAPNAAIENFSFNISNNGAADVPSSQPFDIQIVLSQDSVLGNDGDLVIATITDSDGLPTGETRQYGTGANPLDLTVPGFVSQAGSYFIGVIVDSGELIPEANENNNELLSDSASLQITPAIDLNIAIDDPDALNPARMDLSIGGANGWFGTSNALIADGSSSTSDGTDAAQSAPISAGVSSYFQATVDDGPKILKYRWKVDSEPNANRLEFAINGVVQEQISGQVGWDFGFGSFTLTLDGETTAPISSVQPQGTTLADAIETALNDLPGVAVTVTGGPSIFTITFDDDGNQAPLDFNSLSPLLVSSDDISSIQGTETTQEVQTLTVIPNVSFRLEYQGVLTDPLPYTATAAEVAAALNSLQASGAVSLITGGVSVAASGDLDFEVTFNDVGERDEIGIRTSGLRRPVTVDSTIDTEGTVGTAQVQSFSISPEVTVFVPAGVQELRWTYRKTTEGGDYEDAGWVDQVSLTDFNGPELVLSNVNYTAGEYVLDVETLIDGDGNNFLGTRYLDITVEAVNRGDTLPVFPDDPLPPDDPLDHITDNSNISSADIEVRLSVDRQYGNGDDIILGSFAQAEGGLDAGELLRFIGPLPLGDNIPEGFYYLMAKIDTFALVADDEFSVSNNVWIAAERDVQITRLPNLDLVTSAPAISRNEIGHAGDFFDLDEEKVRYESEPFKLNLTIRNTGLGRVEGSDIFDNSVELVGFLKEDLANLLAGEEPPTLEDYQGLGTAYSLGDFSIQELLRGRSFDEAPPGTPYPGDSVSMIIEGFFPSRTRLVQGGVVESDRALSEYAFYLRFNIDSDSGVRESGEVNRRDGFDPNEFGFATVITGDNGTPLDPSDDPTENVFLASPDDGLFEINPLTIIDGPDWATLYGVLNPVPLGGDSDGDGASDFLEYAFNRNPNVNDSAGINGAYGEVVFEGEEYLSIAFDFVALADDLSYFVEAADNVGFTIGLTTLAEIEGPYTASVGISSLTGAGGLIDGGALTVSDPTNADDYVLDVVDYGYGARITVRDAVPMSDASSRFMRIRVVPVP